MDNIFSLSSGTIYRLLILTLKTTAYAAMAFAFIAILSLIGSTIFIALNMSVLGDLHSLIQMWLPFNLSVILLWIITVSASYITYRLSSIAAGMLDNWLK